MDSEAVMEQVMSAHREMQPKSRALFHIASGIILGGMVGRLAAEQGKELGPYAVDTFIAPLLTLADPGDQPLILDAMQKLVRLWAEE